MRNRGGVYCNTPPQYGCMQYALTQYGRMQYAPTIGPTVWEG